MKLEPGFITHWKTERLIDQLGAEAVIVVLKIWSKAQIKRQWKGLELTAKRLAMETKWKGDENHLFSVLTDPDAPWLDLEEDGTYSIHDFEEHQRQVIHLWSAGGRGGRPKKSTPSKEENISTSSSSSPICLANGSSNENHMVPYQSLCTLSQAISYAPTIRMNEEEATLWWHTRESSGWTMSNANGGVRTPIRSWQSDMARAVTWVKESVSKQKTADKKEFTSNDFKL